MLNIEITENVVKRKHCRTRVFGKNYDAHLIILMDLYLYLMHTRFFSC